MIQMDKFRFLVADTDELKKATFRLRYDVYVDEFGFEKPEDHPGGYETDEYEHCSIHFAAIDEHDEVIGTVRLVRHSEKGFPIEHATKVGFIGPKPPPERIAEISRLAVSRNYRRRKGDGLLGVESYLTQSEGGILPDEGPVPDEYRSRKNPIIVLGLYQIMYHESKRRGITHWYMITEDKLFNTLKKYDILFEKIGDPVEYHGHRTPYLGILSKIEDHLIRNHPDFMRVIHSHGP